MQSTDNLAIEEQSVGPEVNNSAKPNSLASLALAPKKLNYIAYKDHKILESDLLRLITDGEEKRKCHTDQSENDFVELDIEDIKRYQDSVSPIPTGTVKLVVSCGNHNIVIFTKWCGNLYETRFIIDGNNKSALPLQHKKQLYLIETKRNADLLAWLKQKLNIQKKYADEIIANIREEADAHQQSIDNLKNELSSYQNIIPGYEGYKLYSVTDNGAVIVDTNEIARAIIEKLHLVSYKKAIWEYRHGVYIQNDGQVHEEIVKIYKAIGGIGGSIVSLSKDIIYCIINDHHTYSNPFNRFLGIPVANGVIEINFDTGEEKLIDYTPDMKFDYKLPTKYDRSIPTDAIYKLLRSWVYENDIQTLIQIPAQTLLQKIFRYAYKKFYLINGGRDAGKTKYMDLNLMLLSVLSEEDPKCEFGFTKNYTSISLKKLTNNTFAKSGLRNRLINSHGDMTQFYMDETGDFKETLGGIEGHNTEKKGKDAQEDTITAVHVFACNQLPFVANKVLQDDDFWPKMEYLYFPYHYGKDDTWDERNLTEVNCSAYLNLVLDMMKKIKKQHRLAVDSEGEDTLRRFKEDALPIMRFVKSNMVETHGPVKHDKRTLMLAYVFYCKDRKIDDMKEFAGVDQDIIAKAIDMLNDPEGVKKILDINTYSIENKEERYAVGDMINIINKSLAAFSKKLFAVDTFKSTHTTIDGLERQVYSGNWKFKETSKYKVPAINDAPINSLKSLDESQKSEVQSLNDFM
jgi:hypothetical protein